MNTFDQDLIDVRNQTTRLDSIDALMSTLHQRVTAALAGTTLAPDAQTKLDKAFTDFRTNRAGVDAALNANVPLLVDETAQLQNGPAYILPNVLPGTTVAYARAPEAIPGGNLASPNANRSTTGAPGAIPLGAPDPSFGPEPLGTAVYPHRRHGYPASANNRFVVDSGRRDGLNQDGLNQGGFATALSKDMDSSTTTMNVANATGSPKVPFSVRCESEAMTVTSTGSGKNWTVTRGTNATAHAAPAAVTRDGAYRDDLGRDGRDGVMRDQVVPAGTPVLTPA